MRAGLLPEPNVCTEDDATALFSAEFEIAMLDGELGAVPGAADPAIAPVANESCWCGCFVCFLPPDAGRS
jgi:hypothetical protein